MGNTIYVRINTGEVLKYVYTNEGVTCENISGDIYEVKPDGYGYNPEQLFCDPQNTIVSESDWNN